MARTQSSPWTLGGQGREEAITNMFAAMRAQAHHELGSDVSVATADSSDLVGLPLPAFCLRYFFQSTVFPLSRITQITGQEGSAKSAFLDEMIRWHVTYGGGGVIAENEDKDSPELRASILRWNPSWLRRVHIIPTYSMEGWQDVFTEYVDVARNQQDVRGGPGRTVPILFGVDSIMATAPLEEINAVREAGHAFRGFALAANLIARYMRTMPERIRNYPFSIVGTNHLKPAMTPSGIPTSNIPGGKAIKFMETYEIEMSQSAAGKDIDLLEYGGLRLRMVCRKNSLGPSRKAINAELLWWQVNIEGTFRQMTIWDWDTASIELLLSFASAKGKVTIYRALQDICDISVADNRGRVGWSTKLGVPKSDPQPFRVLGSLLEQRPELLHSMYQLLGITIRRPFQPGVDYLTLLDSARTEVNAAAVQLYDNVAAMPLAQAGELGVDAPDAVAPEAPERPLQPDDLPEDGPLTSTPSVIERSARRSRA